MPDSATFIVPLVSPEVGDVVGIQDLIARVRKLVLDEPYEDFLIQDDGQTSTIQVNSPDQWDEGDILEFRDASLEQVKVRIGLANPLNVKRGHNDTTPATHPTGLTVLKNARFTGDEIAEHLKRVAYGSWPEAWQVEQFSISPSATKKTYAAPDDIVELVSVTQLETGTSDVNSFYYGEKGCGYPVGLEFQVDPSISSNGVAVRFGGLRNTVNPILVSYQAYITPNTISEGLMADCIVMGAVARILGMRQIQRSGIDVRQAEPGLASAYLQDAAFFQQEYQRLLRRLHLQLLNNGKTTPMRTWA